MSIDQLDQQRYITLNAVRLFLEVFEELVFCTNPLIMQNSTSEITYSH